MLNAAGAHGRLAAAQWLRQRGAEWPAELVYGRHAWTGEVLTWARCEDCTAPTVSAQPLPPAEYGEPLQQYYLHYHSDGSDTDSDFD
jgi:hypothetical protein